MIIFLNLSMDSYNEQERKKAMLSAFKQTFRKIPQPS